MKEDVVVQRLSPAVNAVVVQLPERRRPGVVIQGDSLRNLHALAHEVRRQLAGQDYAEAEGVAAELAELLAGYIASLDEATAT
ncbi:MAG: hypothetical protein AAF790_12820 [Planctomycetota bacterium]